MFVIILGAKSSFAGDAYSVKFYSTAYADRGASLYNTEHDIIQYFVEMTSGGFSFFDIVGAPGSRPLLNYSCSDEDTMCWISLNPAIVSVYPRRCPTECQTWSAYGFKFEKIAVKHMVFGKSIERVHVYRVLSPNGNFQIQLFSDRFRLVGFTDFSGDGELPSRPVFMRTELDDQELFPFDSAPVARQEPNTDIFKKIYGISWEESVAQSGIEWSTEHTVEVLN